MKLPEMRTKNKIRDCKICQLYMEDYMAMSEIASRVGLTPSRVQQILYKNRDLLLIDKNYERLKRVNWLKRQIKLRGNTQRDAADLIAQLHAELDDGKPSVVNVNKVTIGNGNGKLNGEHKELQDRMRAYLRERLSL